MLTLIGGLGVVGGVTWWLYWPHHTFSSSVAKILRKGLWAESDREGNDYKKALEYYIEALQLAQSENLDPLSDEYTGIQLKIGQMYEQLSMFPEALMIYTEICSNYLVALTTPGAVSNSLRPHLIQKDLRVVIKCAQLNTSDPQMCKLMLMTHLLVAQEEVAKKSAAVAKLISRDSLRADQEDVSITSDANTVEESLKDPTKLQLNRGAWEPFRDELFNARELYVALCISTGDIWTAARTATATVAWMINAECSPVQIIECQNNLGSVLFLNAEALGNKISQGTRSGMDESELNQLRQGQKQSLKSSEKCYESVLQFSKRLPTEIRRAEGMEESIALATYSLGVVKLHNGELIPARNLLREARLRAKAAGYEELIQNAENELGKVRDALEKTDPSKESPSDANQIEALLEAHDKGPSDFTVDVAKSTR